MAPRIQATIDALQGDLTGLGSRGTNLIQRWETELEGADWRGAKPIHEDLGRLRRQLEGDDLDAAKIGELLTKLGESTGRAEHAEGADRDRLQSLGSALQEAGASLGR